jgi:hypothetical protein
VVLPRPALMYIGAEALVFKRQLWEALSRARTFPMIRGHCSPTLPMRITVRWRTSWPSHATMARRKCDYAPSDDPWANGTLVTAAAGTRRRGADSRRASEKALQKYLPDVSSPGLR